MKVSVIIPAFNEEKHITAALSSLSTQTKEPDEIIVVDNNSTDKTAEMSRSFDPRIKVISEPNKGTMWACERGRKESHGDIIIRMDADCTPESRWIEKGLKHFLTDSNVVVVSGPYDYTDAGPFFRFTSFNTQKYFFWIVNNVLQLFRAGGVTLGGNTFMKAEALERAGGFNTNLTFYGDDTDVPKRLSRFGKCIFDPNLVSATSVRRYKEHGHIKLTLTYWKHFFKVIFGM
jgi:glycosyltransferase involved in cell wall biosynthesis